ncbi:PAS domain-containing sensor histidine kinase [Deinococcus hohokamensis]|uniref:histidine kinase n=1 Tax=Deinococcus hohokamensis TaxID=309883 RepID=A0ABV9I6Z4_9DEIO
MVAPPFTELDAAAFLGALPDPLLHLGAGGEVTLNASAQERLGQLKAGQSWAGLFLPDAAATLEAAAARARAGETVRASVRVVDSVAPALVTLTPDGRGGALLHLRKARDPLEVALELLDGLNLGMTVQDAQARMLYANQSAQEILGLSLAQLTGRSAVDERWHTLHPDGQPFAPDAHPAARSLKDGQVHRDVPMGVFHPPSGEVRWLSVTSLPRRAPGTERPEQVTSVFQDVTDQRRMQAEVRRSEQRFRSLVEASAQIVWNAEPDGRFLPPQPAWEAFTGQGPAEYAGDGWLQAVHPEDRAQTLRDWQKAVTHNEPHLTEHRLRRSDGQYVPMQVRAVPVFGPDGELREWIGTYTDISAVREAEAHLRELNATLEQRVQQRTQELAQVTRFSTLLLMAAGEGIFGLDLQGRTTFANPAAARILGYSIERMIGVQQHPLIHHHHENGQVFPVQACPIHHTLQDGQTRRIEQDVFWHAQGHTVPVAYVVTPTLDDQGQPSGAVVMFQDVTERRRAQQELRDAILELERSNENLEQFAYVVSHDLQEPLRTLGSYTELLVRRHRGELGERGDQYLDFMQDAVTRMRSLIQDLLAFARVGHTERQGAPQAVSLEAVGQQAAANVEGTLQATGGQLELHLNHQVLGHPTLLTQLLTNLISNGLKFHRAGETPRVIVRSEQQGGIVQVSVQDNGIGIAPEHHERVFTIFQRLHGRGDFPGNGIGLAICRKIVEHHGGRLWLDSAPDQGSIFSFTLPAAAPLPT